MGLEVLLALIVGASVQSVPASSIAAASITTVGGGILSNRADAAFWWGCQSLLKVMGRQADAPMHEELRKALQLSYLQALKTVCLECRTDLVGEFEMKYRLQSTHPPEIKNEIRWLEGQLTQIAKSTRSIEKGDLTAVPQISMERLEALATQAGQTVENKHKTARKEAVKLLINGATSSDAMALYLEKLTHSETGLFARICGYFAQHLAKNLVLQAFFETQLLIQINGGLRDQMITLESMQDTLDGLAQIVPQQMNESLSKLEGLESGQATVVERTDAILELSQEIKALITGPEGVGFSVEPRGDAITPKLATGESLVPNPFAPLGGRIDSAENFFGQTSILNNVFERLNSGSSVALIGDREIGKSSLLRAIQRGAKEALNESRDPIYIDLKQV
ncbi:MAG: hypothetical protein AAFR25_08885, partial [Cyanobacteria bacterium J06629_19]